eukprot:CAMPEP_0203809674 /NCGR_PEP_ID=MMETSP0115-20131106/2444_1 /ASSEMBLY_ACC=CAM_ASM_000227 /TAXON_ID=33651 /ORGANISM="Bicosoecid sp, Strain ms1" /LENGTH=42 /DNA_ID= /DNA_START= /DNA_END= /DNA_ORIENTATION=
MPPRRRVAAPPAACVRASSSSLSLRGRGCQALVKLRATAPSR